MRLLSGCERIRKLLSQLPESQITVENMTDNGDMNFSLTRDTFGEQCAPLLERLQTLIQATLKSANVEDCKADLGAIEILGGGK